MAWYEKFTDNFNRDENPLAGDWTTVTESGWYAMLCNTTYNALLMNESGSHQYHAAVLDGVSLGDDQYCQYTLKYVGGGGDGDQHLWLRHQGAGAAQNEGYLYVSSFSNGGFGIYRYDYGVGFTAIDAFPNGPVPANDDVHLSEITGTSLDLYVNSSPRCTGTDSTYGSGYAAVGGYGRLFYPVRADDFSCGDTIAPGAPSAALYISRGRIVNEGGFGGTTRSSVVNSGGQ